MIRLKRSLRERIGNEHTRNTTEHFKPFKQNPSHDDAPFHDFASNITKTPGGNDQACQLPTPSHKCLNAKKPRCRPLRKVKDRFVRPAGHREGVSGGPGFRCEQPAHRPLARRLLVCFAPQNDDAQGAAWALLRDEGPPNDSRDTIQSLDSCIVLQIVTCRAFETPQVVTLQNTAPLRLNSWIPFSCCI
jgi:hypothetical protein